MIGLGTGYMIQGQSNRIYARIRYRIQNTGSDERIRYRRQGKSTRIHDRVRCRIQDTESDERIRYRI